MQAAGAGAGAGAGEGAGAPSPIEFEFGTHNIEEAIKSALHNVQAVIDANQLGKHKRAFVFDIDDTLVFASTKDSDGFRHPCSSPKTVQKLMKRLFDVCKTQGKVYLITARLAREDIAALTVDQLHNHDIYGWERLFLCPARMRTSWDGIAEFKRNARRQIQRKDRRYVLLTIGDRWADHLSHDMAIDRDRAKSRESCAFSVVRINDAKQHTIMALKLPSR